MRREFSAIAILLASAALVAGCREQAGNEQAAGDETAAAAPAVSLVAGSGQCDTPTTPFCDSVVALPEGWKGRVFKLAQDYPAAAPPEQQPWLAFDPATQPDQYIRSVLAYFYEGNIRPSVEDSFDPALNKARKWYNAPWQDYGFNGREPIHGLTRERVNPPGELDPKQTLSWNNYAVGFYNGAGAAAIARVWANRGAPDSTKGIMPEGTVGAKLLFTTATPDQVPYLAGSPTWNAYIYSQVNAPRPDGTRAVVPVRLLQIDIAVKDKRSPTGWVFGTFVYGGGPGAGTTEGSGWTNVSPVGLMWGNDPDYPGTGPLKQSWINPKVTMPHLGYQGRLNGPVDNPASSCLSCHSTAQDSGPGKPNPGMFPPTKAQIPFWFRNVPSGQAFQPPGTSLDYSLQVALGIQNFRRATGPQTEATLADAADETPPRDGAPTH